MRVVLAAALLLFFRGFARTFGVFVYFLFLYPLFRFLHAGVFGGKTMHMDRTCSLGAAALVVLGITLRIEIVGYL